MWRTLNYSMIVAFFVVVIGMEWLRSIVHRYRENRMGLVDHNIAMYGSFIAFGLLIVGAAFGVLSWFFD